jgi:hypothetical protein
VRVISLDAFKHRIFVKVVTIWFQIKVFRSGEDSKWTRERRREEPQNINLYQRLCETLVMN